jgi:hypothetical protein
MHERRPDFLSALSWASMATLEHPTDVAARAGPLAQGRSQLGVVIKASARKALLQHPRLYGFAKRGYRWLRG